jgi:hypothetical protein
MANGWTDERRVRQSKAIRRWKPWLKSTGPRTANGKSRVSRNAWRGGERPKLRALITELKAALAAQRYAIEQIRT